MVSLLTDVQLEVWSDAAGYQPGQTVTVNAAIFIDTTPLTGSTISATLTLPDNSTQSVTFVDDGTNGDTTAGDGLYAAQVTASAMNGHIWLAVSATNGNLQRLAWSGYPVVAQTATFQQVTGVNPVDMNILDSRIDENRALV